MMTTVPKAILAVAFLAVVAADSFLAEDDSRLIEGRFLTSNCPAMPANTLANTVQSMPTGMPSCSTATTTGTTSTTTTNTATTTTVTTTTTIATTTNTATTTTTTVTTTTITTTTTTITTTTTTTTNTATTTTTTSTTTTSTTSTTSTTTTTTATTTTTTTTTATTTTSTNTATTTTVTTTTTTTTNTATTTTVTTTTTTTTNTATTTTATTTTITTTTVACPSVGCKAHWSGATSGCDNLAAGTQSTSCSLQSGTLLSTCMDTSFTLKCPANNPNQGYPDLVSASVKCAPCGTVTVSADKNPKAGEVWFVVTYGALLHKSGATNGAIVEDKVDSWAISLIDSKDRVMTGVTGLFVGTVKGAASGRYSTTCCNPALHSIRVAGVMPSDLKKFMIVPVQSGKMLPGGVLTSVVTDATTGTSQTLTNGTITLNFGTSVSDAQDVANGDIETIIIKALAKTIAGVTEDMIMIRGVTVATSRRLEESFSDDWWDGDDKSRRLAAGDLIVEYTIIFSAAISASDISGSTLVTKMQEVTTALGIQGTVASKISSYSGTPAVAATTSTQVQGTPQKGGAVPTAQTSFALLPALALAMVLKHFLE